MIADASIGISVSPALLSHSGEWVTVSWSGVSQPSAGDWIGIFSPPTNGSIDPVQHAPYKYQVRGKCVASGIISRPLIIYSWNHINKTHTIYTIIVC